MSVKAKGKLDPITFIYGFGAAVILVGSMFKFIGWDYANELFIAGLAIEAVVFIISAFERKVDEKEYHWENVFPQLEQQGSKQEADTSSYAKAMEQLSDSIKSFSVQIQQLNSSLDHINSEMQSNNQATKAMNERVVELNKQMEEYSGYMQQMNTKYKDFLSGGKGQ
jgi:gliding motility-associated protein GldL